MYSYLTFIDRQVGLIYTSVFLIINGVIILNLIIAILASTYEEYVQFKRGLYYDNIVAAIPRFTYDENYGSMTCALGPFSAIQFLLTPFYICLKKGSAALKTLNSFLSFLLYLPYALIIWSFFAITNLILIPIAYVFAIGSKISLVKLKNQQKYPVGESVRDLGTFILFGPLILGARSIIDLVFFTKSLVI